MLAPLYPVRDIRLSGHVIYVGSSSMEIIVKMEALEDGKEDQTLFLGLHRLLC
jgi:acyl-coenzyme A thioesterase 9